MRDDLVGIRTMCETFDVTARALRFYEQKELLFPHREGQKRLYGRRDRARLKLILMGRRFGVNLEEIRLLLDLYDSKDQKRMQLPKAIEVGERRLAEMKAERLALDQTIQELTKELETGRKMLKAPQDREVA